MSFASAQLKIRGSPCLSQISVVASGMKNRSLGVSLMFGSVSGGIPWTMKPTRFVSSVMPPGGSIRWNAPYASLPSNGVGLVHSAVNDPNTYAGPGTGYRLEGERWALLQSLPSVVEPAACAAS